MTDPDRPLPIHLIGLSPGLAADVHAELTPYHGRIAVKGAPPDVPPVGEVALVVVSGATPPHRHPVIVGLVRAQPPVRVVVLTDLDDEDALLSALRLGAAGYLLTEMTAQELVSALERAAAGQIVVDPAMSARMAVTHAHGPNQSAAVVDRWRLRPREREVLDLLVEGRTNREIARTLMLGEETIKTYLRSLYRKLGARDRFDAVAIALGRRR